MDENYLDNLLNEISLDKEIDNKIEDELDQQIQEEKRKKQAEGEESKEEAFDRKLDEEVAEVSDSLDLDFSEEQMEELDALDNLADLDMDNMDFSDIDFDDVDITKLDNLEDSDFDDLVKDFEGDLEIDDFFDRGEQENLPKEDLSERQLEEGESIDESGNLTNAASPKSQDDSNEDLNEDSFDANVFLDDLLNETEKAESDNQSFEKLDEISQNSDSDTENYIEESQADDEKNEQAEDEIQTVDENTDTSDEIPDLDELLSALDINEDNNDSNMSMSEKSDDKDEVEKGNAILSDELEDAAESDTEKNGKKRTIMQILFGDPDEDDELSPEELEAIESKKALKKAEKEAKKAAAKKKKAESDKAKKDLKNDKKKKAADEKARLKAVKKAKKMSDSVVEEEDANKKMNKPMVIFVFTLFLGAVFVFYIGTNNFNYNQAVEKASKYFSKQKYHNAYDEIVGINVKEKDQDLKDRIYTVMYVERLYESYRNNIAMENEEKALDSLLRGVSQYYENYDEAKQLGITDDLDGSFNRIVTALQIRYGISLEQAAAMNEMEDLEYVHTIEQYAENADTSAGVDVPDVEK